MLASDVDLILDRGAAAADNASLPLRISLRLLICTQLSPHITPTGRWNCQAPARAV